MKIVVFGAGGMLGTDLMAECRSCGIQVDGVDLPEVDITSPASLENLDRDYDWAINSAAYTNVDGAETERDLAFKVNAEGAGCVAEWAAGAGVSLAHISTDYVFDGRADHPYRESDPVCPVNIYGASKLEGERLVREKCASHIIIRGQSLFGVNGSNFVHTIAGLLRKGDGPVRVVDDQISSPTYTRHLARGILQLLNSGKQGIVHVSAEGECSWYDFARAIADRLTPGAEVLPVKSAEFPRPARRPEYSVLDKAEYIRLVGSKMPSWLQGLDDLIEEEAGSA